MKKLAVSLLFATVFASVIIPTAMACKTQGYWKNHPDAWPVDMITLGGVTYTKAEAIDILKTEPDGDCTYILAKQLIAAKLNYAMGWLTGSYAPLIDAADDFLSAHPLGSDPRGADRDYCLSLKDALDILNNTK